MFKFSNMHDVKNRVEAIDISSCKVREILGFSSPMNKIGRPNYLSYEKDYFIVAATDI